MSDPTEDIRRHAVGVINSAVKSNDAIDERTRLENKYGQVWDTSELTRDFEVKAFLAPFVSVKKKDTGENGTMLFQHSPRFYFEFNPSGF
jgi:hypothetical protein